jgi:hypothetical protein
MIDAESLALDVALAIDAHARVGLEQGAILCWKRGAQDHDAQVAQQTGDKVVIRFRPLEHDGELTGNDSAGHRFLPVAHHRFVLIGRLQRGERQSEHQRTQRLDSEQKNCLLERTERPFESVQT